MRLSISRRPGTRIAGEGRRESGSGSSRGSIATIVRPDGKQRSAVSTTPHQPKKKEPLVEVIEEEDHIRVVAELPGIDVEAIEKALGATFVNGILHLKLDKDDDTTQDGMDKQNGER